MKRIIMLLLACCLLVGAAAAAGGSGTAADPYIIETPQEFQSIQNDLTAHYKLGNNLDFSGFSFTIIGSSSAPFYGYLDGAGYTISNLIINSESSRCGIFSTSGGKFSNLIIKDSIVSSYPETYAAILVGYLVDGLACDNIIIDNCIVRCKDYSAAIAAAGYSGDCSFQNCIIRDSTISASWTAVGLSMGSTTGNEIFEDISIENTCINGGTTAVGVSGTSTTMRNCELNNVNLYSNNIILFPSGVDSSNTATGITNVANRYLYASGLSASTTGATASYTLEGRQGSTTVEAPAGSTGTAQSWEWVFGDGQTATTPQDTTHTYSAPGTYTTSLTLKNYLDSTGITVSTSPFNILPIAPTISASTGTAQLGDTVTLTATGILYTSLQWQYSPDGGTTWQDISGATTSPYSWTPAAGQYSIRALVSDAITGYTATSNTVSLGVYAPPTITAVSVSPTIGQYTQTITLSAEVTDSGPTATTYQWQQSPQGQSTWTNIPGATTAQWIGQLTFSGATDFRLIATGTGGQTISQTVTYYIALPGEIQSLTATPSVVALPGSTTLSATGANVITWEWQELISGTWTTIGYGASLQESLTTEGTYEYRVLATGADGTTITSETVEVLAGYAPTVSITSPADNVQFPTQSQITVSADITGTDVVYEWDFGSLQTVNGGNTNPTWVTYLVDGQYTITLRAESIFGSTSDSVTIVSGVMPRPMATEKFDAISTSPVTAFVESFNIPQGEILDLPAVFGALTAPMSDLLPDGMFMVIVFGVIFIMLWIMTKNTAVPSIIGLIFGGFILALLPASYNGAAVVILAISIVGGVIRVFIPPK